MVVLIYIGAVVSLIGVGVLFWCIGTMARARREGLDDAALRARLQKVVAWNLGAVAISALGLMMVIAGMLLA